MTFDLARYQDPLTIQRVLLDAKTIAVVGLSGNPLRASNFVGFYLQRHGYRVIPVNPREPEIFGERSYASLRDVPVAVDIVDVFRAPAALPEIARDAVAIGAGEHLEVAGALRIKKRAGWHDLLRDLEADLAPFVHQPSADVLVGLIDVAVEQLERQVLLTCFFEEASRLGA